MPRMTWRVEAIAYPSLESVAKQPSSSSTVHIFGGVATRVVAEKSRKIRLKIDFRGNAFLIGRNFKEEGRRRADSRH